jgi:AAA family ATP:ADP antiporter
MISRLKRFLDLRPGEALPVLISFVYIAIVMASFLLSKPIRNALFLKEYGPYPLAYVYVAVPLALSVFVPVYTRIAGRFGQRPVIVATLAFFGVTVLGFWYAFTFRPFWSLSAIFYVWVNCYGIIASVQAWTVVNSFFDPRQGRRLFGVIGAGASVGGIVGGLLGKLLVGPIGGTVNLLLVLAALIALAAGTVLLSTYLLPRRRRPGHARPPRTRFRETLALIPRSPYLRLITAAVFLVALATQWTGFQLLLVADERYGGDPDPHRITEFLSEFNVYLGLVAILVQILLTGPALRRFGVPFALPLLPLALCAGTTVILLVPGFWTVVLTNGFDQGLRFSVDKSAYELLYLPLAPGIRANVKSTIDIIVNRAADAFGGVMLGLATSGFIVPGLGVGLRGTAAVNLVVIFVWLGVVWRLRRAYVGAIHESIHQHRLDSDRAAPPMLERSAADALADKLASRNVRDVVYALDLLESQQPPQGGPLVRGLLKHPDSLVRRRALSVLSAAGDDSVTAEVEALLQEPDLEMRTEALLYLARVTGIDPLEKVRELGDFQEFSIRAGMLSFMASPGPTQNIEAARAILDGMVSDRDARARLEAARLLPRLSDEFDAQLTLLLRDLDLEVTRHAVRAVGALRKTAFAAPLVDLLGHTELGADAADALSRLGDVAVRLLRERMFDDRVPIDMRRDIPGVLLRIGTPAAERALMESLLQSDPTLRYRIISSLNKLRQLHPEVRLDPQVIEILLAAEITGHYRSYQVLSALGGTLEAGDPVVQGLSQSMEQEVERIFRLMALLYPDTDLHSAYFGLRSENTLVRANALEFLDNVLKPQLRSLLVPLLDSQVTIAERVEIANRIVGAPVESVEQAVTTLLASEDPWLRSCAAYAAGTLQLHALEPELERLEFDSDPLLRETVRTARRRLAGDREPPPEGVGDADLTSGEWETGTIGVG